MTVRTDVSGDELERPSPKLTTIRDLILSLSAIIILVTGFLLKDVLGQAFERSGAVVAGLVLIWSHLNSKSDFKNFFDVYVNLHNGSISQIIFARNTINKIREGSWTHEWEQGYEKTISKERVLDLADIAKCDRIRKYHEKIGYLIIAFGLVGTCVWAFGGLVS